jgi:hypothetical protein
VNAGFEPIGLPMVALLVPVEHIAHTVAAALDEG